MPLRLSPLLIVISLVTALAPCATSARGFVHSSPSSQRILDESVALALTRQARPTIVTLRERLAHDPGRADLLIALGEAFERIGDLERAMAAYREALVRQPDVALGFYRFWMARRTHLARTGAASFDRPGGAEGLALSDVAPTFAPPGRPGEQAGTGSREHGSQLMVPRGPSEDHIRRGLMLAGQGRLEAAVDAYFAALAAAPDNPAARLHLAQSLMLQRRWQEARVHLEEAVSVAPDLAPVHYTLGIVRYTLNDLAGSVQAYQRALQADPTFAEARYQLGMLLQVLGREDRAVEHLLLAAQAGVTQAQFLVGSAFAHGRGVALDPARGLGWWFEAAEGGSVEARDAIVRFRRLAQSGPDAGSAREAFARYRAILWAAHPDLGPPGQGAVLGQRLLSLGRVQEAIPVLMREAEALSEEAHRLLEVLYEVGVQGALAPQDPRLLAFFQTAAEEDLARSMLVLGRLYRQGLGVAPDAGRAARWFTAYLATTSAGLEATWQRERGQDPQQGRGSARLDHLPLTAKPFALPVLVTR